MTSLEENQATPRGIGLSKYFDTAAFVVAVGGFLVLAYGLSQVSVSLIFIGALGLFIGLLGGGVLAILRFLGDRAK
jgi:hypothetical protein